MQLMLIGVLTFGILVFAISYVIVRKYKTIEPAQMATFIVLLAWGAFICGIFIEHVTGGGFCSTILGH
jgi:hypothetical protein